MLMTMMKRGSVETREWMRTQDPRLAPLTELAAKDGRKERLLSAPGCSSQLPVPRREEG